MVEWLKLKHVVKSQTYPRDRLQVLWTLIAQYHSEEFPNLIKLASLALTHPVHTADCERAFSNQNLVTTALRNRLSAEHIQQLMLVNIEGGPLDQFNFVDAIVNWRSSKKRSIFNHHDHIQSS